jgi:transcriptional regulator with XRE-family HTH domain
MPMTRETFGAKLAMARAAAGFRTAGEAADRIGIARNGYYKLERGEVMPGLDRFAEIVDVLGLDPRTFFPEWFAGSVPVEYLKPEDRKAIASQPAPQVKRGRGRPRKAG